MKTMTGAEILYFRKHGDERGTLVAVEEGKEIPFAIKRVYYIYGTAPGIRRGYHAHKTLEQVLICVHGSCKILLDDGVKQETVLLDHPEMGLYIGNAWHEMYDFSSGAVLIVLASACYDEEDYIRDYNEFLKFSETQTVSGVNNYIKSQRGGGGG